MAIPNGTASCPVTLRKMAGSAWSSSVPNFYKMRRVSTQAIHLTMA